MDGLTSKERHQIVEERSQGLCEICYSSNIVQHHHVIGGKGKRNPCETVYSLIALCWDHHHGTNGIHGKNGHKLDLQLKKNLERTYREMDLTEEEIKYWLGGRFYL